MKTRPNVALIVETSAGYGPHAHIVEVTGFTHPEYMMVQFKRMMGQASSPGAVEESSKE